jgi:mersacidin/lichenicidin family type 2 lantibiotic
VERSADHYLAEPDPYGRNAKELSFMNSGHEFDSAHPLAQVYLARALDPLVQAAGGVARDVVERPDAYPDLPETLTQLLSDFRTYTGIHPEWPDAAQRGVIAHQTLSRFSVSFVSLRRAAISFAGAGSNRTERIGRRTLAEEAQALRLMAGLVVDEELAAPAVSVMRLLDRATTVLTSAEVAAAVGVATPAGGVLGAEMAYLCERVSKMVPVEATIRLSRLTIVQRAAAHGAATLAAVLDGSFDEDDDEQLDSITQSALGWAAALGDLLSRIDIVRAWTDPSYRDHLMTLERDLVPPHPAGEISIEGTALFRQSRKFGLSLSTETVQGEICCCSGQVCNTEPSTDDDCPTLIIMPPVVLPPR